ncbi:MAG TPA: response regulator [Allosphingosinicella sp.]|nr:response regulator [Allosphingosinicella sp.]
MSDNYVIAIVDDDEAVRHSTAGLLKRAGHRVESFTAGPEFLASVLPKDFDCLLLDMRMPGLDGLGVMRALRERSLSLPILVLTGHGDVPMAVEAMRLGAIDFLEKPYPPAALLEAIARACTAPPPGPGGQVVNNQAQAKVAALSDRQRDVLRGILRGQPNKIIAWELGLSIRTVETYRAQMLEKLGVRGTAEAVRLALAAGLSDGAPA